MKKSASETEELLGELKLLYRARSITYADAAQALGVSPNSIKRYMKGALNVATFEQLCQVAGIGMRELFELSKNKRRTQEMTQEQEIALARDQVMALIYYLLDGGWSAEEIRGEFDLSEARLVGCLTQLDRLGFIKLFPGNRIIISIRIPWDGLHSQYLINVLKGQWNRALADGQLWSEGAPWRLGGARLSPQSVHKMGLKFKILVQEAFKLMEEDRHLPPDQVDWYILCAALRKGLFIEGLKA